MITEQQWFAFGLCVQERKSKKVASEIMGLTYDAVKDLLADLKKQEPELFPVESEKANIRQYMSSKERARYNANVVSYDARKDEIDGVDAEIKQKF